MATMLEDLISRGQQDADRLLGMYSKKAVGLAEKTPQKEENLFGKSRPVMIESIPDGDGFVPVVSKGEEYTTPKERENRQRGYNAYEIQHPELMNDPEHIKRLELQRQQYSKQFGKPLDQVSYEDIYEQGNKEAVQNLYSMTRGADDPEEVDLGPTDYWRKNPVQLGSEETPLNVAINAVQEDGGGKYGRTLATAFNPETQGNVNEEMQTGYNAMYFKDQKSKSGKSIPDFARMDKKNQAVAYKDHEATRPPEPGEVEKGNLDLTKRKVLKNKDGSISTESSISIGEADGTEVLIPTVVDGKRLSNEEAQAHYFKTGEHLGKFQSPEAADLYAQKLHEKQNEFYTAQKPESEMTTYEKVLRKMKKQEAAKGGGSDRDGYWGETADIAQSAAAQYYAGTVDMVGELGFNLGKKIGLVDEKEEYKGVELGTLGVNSKVAKESTFSDDWAGVNKQKQQQQAAKFDAEWEKGNHFTAMLNEIPNVPQHLARSLPEMISLATGLGIANTVAVRTNNQADEFEKNNNRKMTATEMGTASLTNAAVLVAERFLIKAGINPGKGLGIKATDGIAKELVKRSVGVGVSTSGEGLQELLDQAQEQFNTQKIGDKSIMEILTSEESLKAGAMGAVVGGTLKGGFEGAKAVGSAPGQVAKAAQERKEVRAGEYLGKEDKGLLDAVTETRRKPAAEALRASKTALKDLDEVTSFEELEKHPTPEVRAAAQAAMKDYKGIPEGSTKHKAHVANVLSDILSKGGKSGNAVKNMMKNTFNIDTDTATTEEIQAAIQEAPIDTVDSITKRMKTRLSTDVAQALEIETIKSENLDATKNTIKTILENRIGIAEGAKTVSAAVEARVEKGYKKSGERTATKDVTIDTKAVSEGLKESIPAKILKVMSLRSTNFENTVKKLNEYTDRALEMALKDPEATPKLKDAVAKVKQRRSDAKRAAAIDSTQDRTRRFRDETKTETRKEITDSLVAALQQKTIGDTRDKAVVQKYLDVAKEKGYITEGAANTFQKRLDKISKDAKEPTTEELAAEAEIDRKPTKTQADTQEELVDINEQADVLNEELDKLNAIQEPTEEEKAKITQLNADKKALGQKKIAATRDLVKFAEEDFEINERYSSMDGIDTKAEFLDPNAFFSKDEIEFLNICA